MENIDPAALQRINDELISLRAEGLLSGLLAKHAISILIRRSNEPSKVLEQLKGITLEAITNLHSDSEDGRRVDEVRSKACDLHQVFFSTLGARG